MLKKILSVIVTLALPLSSCLADDNQNNSLTREELTYKISKTLIVPVEDGLYLYQKDHQIPPYFAYVGFGRNIKAQMDNQIDFCGFLKTTHSFYLIDQESQEIHRIPDYPMPHTRDYIKMSENELKKHTDDLSQEMHQFCANINMFPMIDFGFFSVYKDGKPWGWRNLAEEDKDLDDVLDWSKKYGKDLLDNNILITYKHYPFSFNNMWSGDLKYCDSFPDFRECRNLIIQKDSLKKIKKVLNSIPDYSILMFGSYYYFDPVTKEAQIAMLDPKWRKIIDESSYKGLVISDDLKQIISFHNPNMNNAQTTVMAWKNVDALMILYDYELLQKVISWLVDAYEKGDITEEELNNKIEKLNKFNTQYQNIRN